MGIDNIAKNINTMTQNSKALIDVMLDMLTPSILINTPTFSNGDHGPVIRVLKLVN